MRQVEGHFGRTRRVLDKKQPSVTFAAEKGAGEVGKEKKDTEKDDDSKSRAALEDINIWEDTSEGGLIFEKAAPEQRQSDDPGTSLSRVVRAASFNKLVGLLTSDEEHGTLRSPSTSATSYILICRTHISQIPVSLRWF